MKSDDFMETQFILNDYVRAAMAFAKYETLEDGTVAGRIPPCPGVIVFANDLAAWHKELHAPLQAWVALALEKRQPLPELPW